LNIRNLILKLIKVSDQILKIYSKPRCINCDATKRMFDQNGIEYEVLDISVDEKAMEFVVKNGFQAAPVVVYNDISWCGMRPDMIQKVTQEILANSSEAESSSDLL